MQDGTTSRLGRASVLALAAAGLALGACGGGGPQMRDVPYPSLADRAPEAEPVGGDALQELVAGAELTWRDSREEVAFESTVTYGSDGSATGSWQNSDTERNGDIQGSWEVQQDQLCVTYAVSGNGNGGGGLNCYSLYRQGGTLYLVGAEDQVFETADAPSGSGGSESAEG